MLHESYMKQRAIILLIGILFMSNILLAQSQKYLDGEKTILFVDNQDIEYYAGVKRKINKLTRHDKNPVIFGKDKPWENQVAYCSIYRNPETGLYQMWYQSYVGGDTKDKSLRCVVCYAESQDGINWKKPELEIFPFYEIKKTNIVLLSNKARSGHYGASVVVDPKPTQPSRKYKMAYWDFVQKDGKDLPGLCVAFSPDGIHWTKYENNLVLHGTHGDSKYPPILDVFSAINKEEGLPIALTVSDVIDAIYDERIEKFVIYSKTWLDGPQGKLYWKRAVVRTESKDFINWSKPELVMWPDEFDDGTEIKKLVPSTREIIPANKREKVKGAQLHSGPAFYYNDMYFSLLQVLDLDVTGLMPSELAISRDGLNWKRPFREEFFLPVDGGDSFDSGTIWSNATPIYHEEEIWFYYGAYIAWHSELPQYDNKLHSGIGLATMPLDRFSGLEPIDRFGQVTLKPLDLSKYKSITINANAKAGSVKVELLNIDGYRIKDFTKDEAIEITGDELRHEVTWKIKELSDLPEGKYVIRILLDKATLYAITFLY